MSSDMFPSCTSGRPLDWFKNRARLGFDAWTAGSTSLGVEGGWVRFRVWRWTCV